MNWRISAITAAILILPFGTYAVRANSEINRGSTMEWSQFQNKQFQNKHGNKMGRRGGIEKLLQQLDLTSEQSAQIEAIQERSKTDNQTLWQQMQTNRQEMQSLLTSNASADELRATHQNVQNIQQELGNNRFETMLEIREVLTPEQRTQMAELMSQSRARRFGN